MSLSDYIDDVLPGWMRRSSRAHWLALCNTVAHVIDAAVDGLYEGRLAAMPGQIDEADYGGFESLDALQYIGRDRRLVRGPSESPADYARRLRAWRSTWRTAGTAAGLLGAIRAVMSPATPLLRVVSSAGAWWTLAADGTLTIQTTDGHGLSFSPDGTTATPDATVAHPWDWDSGYGVSDEYRLWPIIYAPTHPPYLADIDGQWGDGLSKFGKTDAGTIGTTAPHNYVAMVREICQEWSPAGMRVPAIIVAYDSASFDPATPGPYPAAGMPDGYWLHHGRLVMSGPSQRWVRARLSTARYWKGTV